MNTTREVTPGGSGARGWDVRRCCSSLVLKNLNVVSRALETRSPGRGVGLEQRGQREETSEGRSAGAGGGPRLLGARTRDGWGFLPELGTLPLPAARRSACTPSASRVLSFPPSIRRAPLQTLSYFRPTNVTFFPLLLAWLSRPFNIIIAYLQFISELRDRKTES